MSGQGRTLDVIQVGQVIIVVCLIVV